jgi:ATP-binding cassette, subfamily B, bacterial
MPNPYLSLLKTAWRYARTERKKFVLVYSLFVCANVVSAIEPILYGWFINQVQSDNNNILKNTVYFIVGYVSLQLCEWAFHGPARVLERQLAFHLSRNFLQELYHQTLQLPVKWHQDHHSGSTISRIRKAYSALKDFFQNGFMYLHALSKLVFSFAAIFYFSPIFGLIGVVMGLITVLIIIKFDKPFIETQNEVNEREHVISSTLFDSLSNIITVITLRLEKSMEVGLLNKVMAVYRPFRKNVIVNEQKWFVASILISVTYCMIAFGYVYQNWKPNEVFLVGGLVTLLGFVNQFTSVFQDVAWQYTEIISYNTDVQTARSIGESFSQSHRPEAATPLPDQWQQIKISNLSFSHREVYSKDHAPQGLHNISIELGRGKKVAVIGESGCGKSTLLAIMRGLYDPENNCQITVDGLVYPDLATLNQTVTLFPQEPEIFENTIAYNITLGLPFEADEIAEVCENAHFGDVVTQLPNGLESNIQEKGVNLSGGQKQRLALARGILAARDSQVVLLDEPTSSVDPKTESLIYEKLFSAFADKAIVSSLHRLHLLRYFDYVYVMDKGRVVAEGTFESLKANNLIFQELWKHQEQVTNDYF